MLIRSGSRLVCFVFVHPFMTDYSTFLSPGVSTGVFEEVRLGGRVDEEEGGGAGEVESLILTLS